MADVSTYTQGTIFPAPSANLEEIANSLRGAMKGLGTDEDTIIKQLISINNEQRQALKERYKTMFDRDLISDLKSELSGWFEHAVMAMMVPTMEYAVTNLDKALQKLGDKRIIVDLLSAQRSEDITKLKDAYEKKFNRTVEASIGNLLTGDFKKLVMALLTAKRQVQISVSKEEIVKDVDSLYKAGEGRLGTDENIFIDILTTRSFEHLRQLYDAYEQKAKNSIEKAIESETSGEFKIGLMGIVMYSRDPLAYYSARIMKSMRGIGTDDDSLIRLLVSRSELDLADIKSKFIKTHRKTMQEWVEGDTSGDYKKLLVAIVRGNGDVVAKDIADGIDLKSIGEIDPEKPFKPAAV